MAMTMSGDFVLPADKATVWAKLNDPGRPARLHPRLPEPRDGRATTVSRRSPR